MRARSDFSEQEIYDKKACAEIYPSLAVQEYK